MKTVLFFLAVLAAPLLAQPGAPLRFVRTDPAGSCSVSAAMQYNTANGKLWGCDAGTWTQISGGGGGSSAFNAITSGTNTTAAMHVGTGGSLDATGSGTIAATAVPIGGVTGLGTGVGTWLGTPSGANLASALTTAIPNSALTGSGALTIAGHSVALGGTQAIACADLTATCATLTGVETLTNKTLTNPNLGVAPSGLSIAIPNASSTGTTVNMLAKLTGAPSTAVIAATTDTDGIVGIVVSGAGTTGNAILVRDGTAACVFDGATTAGDYVQISATVGGNCHDTGSATRPASGQILGRVLTTNGAGGTFNMTVSGLGIVGVPVTLGANTFTGTQTAPAFAGSGSDAFINLPSNTSHSFSSGDLDNNAGTVNFNNGTATVHLAQVIASGATALTSSAVSSGACSSATTATATNTATTDTIVVTVNADPTATTGYIPASTGSLYVWSYPTSGNVNFKVCNNTSASITPTAITVNWKVIR